MNLTEYKIANYIHEYVKDVERAYNTSADIYNNLQIILSITKLLDEIDSSNELSMFLIDSIHEVAKKKDNHNGTVRS